MICGNCKQAGKAFNTGLDETIIAELHKRCPGQVNKTWCDCAHVIGVRVAHVG